MRTSQDTVVAAVDDELGTGQVGGSVRDEEGDKLGYFCRGAGPTQGTPPMAVSSTASASARLVPVSVMICVIRASACGVAMYPGVTVFTRMPAGRTRWRALCCSFAVLPSLDCRRARTGAAASTAASSGDLIDRHVA